MGVWASYSLSDLLLFSPETYFRLYEVLNAALWPMHLVAIAVAGGLTVLVWRAPSLSDRTVALLLAVPWGVVAWWFFHRRYAQILPAADGFAVAFAIEAALLVVAGLIGGRGHQAVPVGPATVSRPGLLLLLYALLVHPIVAPAAGRSWHGVELFGLAPDPTALATLGILLTGRQAFRWGLAVIPLLWCLVSGLTYLAMDVGHGLLTPAVAAMAVVATLCAREREAGRPTRAR